MNRKLRKNKWIPVLAVILVLLAPGLFILKPWQKQKTPAGVNLLPETDFSRLQDGESLWYEDAYVHSEAYTAFSFDEGRDGGVSGHIVNRIGNDARFAMDVGVEPDSLYCLSGWIRASCREGLGANLLRAVPEAQAENPLQEVPAASPLRSRRILSNNLSL